MVITDRRILEEGQGVLFCVVGPSASGKGALCAGLRERFGELVRDSISFTTRTPRPGEQEGVNYYFVEAEQFLREVDGGNLLEWEEVHGNFYGTPRLPIEEALRAGKTVLLDIDIKGALKIKAAMPDRTVIVVVVPPSLDVLLERMMRRCPVGDEERTRRVATARFEARTLQEHWHQVDYCLVNDALSAALETMAGIVVAERARATRGVVVRQVLGTFAAEGGGS